jgi:phytol kinase
MINIAIACLLIFVLLLISEFLWRKKIVSSEVSRKFVHIFSGAVVAFLPYFVSYGYIQILSLAFLVVILASLKLNIFRGIHSVKRVTLGEVMYPIGIGVCAFIAPTPWIFTVAILHLSVADALAAMVGLSYGKNTVYKLFGHSKSVYGSLAFMLVSVLIFVGVIFFAPVREFSAEYLLIGVPIILTIVENFSWWGIDNLTIPLMAVVLLSSF